MIDLFIEHNDMKGIDKTNYNDWVYDGNYFRESLVMSLLNPNIHSLPLNWGILY